MTTRILHVVTSPNQMDATAQSAWLAAGLPREDYDVHICALRRRRPPSGPGEKSTESAGVIESRWTLDPAALARLCRQMKHLQPTVVHTWQSPASLYGQAAALLVGTECIVRWEPDRRPRESPLARTLDRMLGTRAGRIVVTCDEIRQNLIQHGTPADRLVVIPYAAPESCETTPDRQQVLHELGLPIDARVIGAAGPLIPSRRFKDLIWAADLLKVLCENVHLVIIGDGPQRWRLRRYCRQLRIEDRVHLLGDRPDAKRLISILDMFWAGGHEASQAGAILTAMAAAVPALAANSPAARDLVIPDQTGVLFPVGNRAALARRAKTLLDDPTLAQRLGKAGQHRARNRFSVDRMVQRYTSLYHELVDRKDANHMVAPRDDR